jgi:hypothetical protein
MRKLALAGVAVLALSACGGSESNELGGVTPSAIGSVSAAPLPGAQAAGLPTETADDPAKTIIQNQLEIFALIYGIQDPGSFQYSKPRPELLKYIYEDVNGSNASQVRKAIAGGDHSNFSVVTVTMADTLSRTTTTTTIRFRWDNQPIYTRNFVFVGGFWLATDQ